MNRTPQHIIENRALGPRFFRMRIACGEDMLRARPGQFVMVRTSSAGAVLLRRPFSIHRVIRDGAAGAYEILYRIVGPGTRALSEMKPGEAIDTLGPLGNGFTLEADMKEGILIAGGVGVAPLVFLAERLATDRRFDRLTVFLGARSEDELLCREDFEKLGLPVHLTTDDGSCGDHCRVTQPLETEIRRQPPDIVFACGPPAMLRCVADMTAALGVPCQVSIEAMMACGIGACLGCAVPESGDSGAYRHACRDGPVFPSGRIRL